MQKPDELRRPAALDPSRIPDPDPNCTHCGGTGWIWRPWSAIIAAAIGCGLLYLAYLGFADIWSGKHQPWRLSPHERRRWVTALLFGLVCIVFAWKSRWERCRCNPSIRGLNEDQDQQL